MENQLKVVHLEGEMLIVGIVTEYDNNVEVKHPVQIIIIPTAGKITLSMLAYPAGIGYVIKNMSAHKVVFTKSRIIGIHDVENIIIDEYMKVCVKEGYSPIASPTAAIISEVKNTKN